MALEGGDNLAQILVIFLAFTVSNAYFAPGAKRRREKLLAQDRPPTVSTALHNLATFLIVFQTAVMHFAAGYWKIFGKVWQNGVAMYYISRETEFHMSATFAHVIGLVCFGLLMTGADCGCLRDEDYRSLWKRLQAGRAWAADNRPPEAGRLRISLPAGSAPRGRGHVCAEGSFRSCLSPWSSSTAAAVSAAPR